MNDARRQLLQESFKLLDLLIMVVALALALWISLQAAVGPPMVVEVAGSTATGSTATGSKATSSKAAGSTVTKPAAEPEPTAADAALPLGPMERVVASARDALDPMGVAVVMSVFFIWHLSLASRGLYDADRMNTFYSESVRVVRGGAFACLVIALIIVGSFPQLGLGDWLTYFLVHFFLFAVGLTIIARVLAKDLLMRLRMRGRNLRSVLVVGTNNRALRFAESVTRRPELGYYLDGFADDEWEGMDGFLKEGQKLRTSLEDLGQYLAENVVDEVVVALPISRAYNQSRKIVSYCQEQGITVRFISQIFDPRLAKGKMDVFDNEPMITLVATPTVGFTKLLKRLLDIVVSGTLLLLLAPLFAIVAWTIKRGSKGPVFFVQERVGHNKRTFPLYKFRTMVEDAEERLRELEHLNEVSGPVFKIKDDPRLTPNGTFLRHSSIDELPQLWNVLKGDMSLVGPRPLPQRDYQGFNKDAHRRRLSVRPGITCLWQIQGRNSIPFERWMQLDLEYIDGWSLWLDIKILLMTIPVVLGPLVLRRSGEFMKRGIAQSPAESEPATSNTGQGP